MYQAPENLFALNKSNLEAAARFAGVALQGAERILELQLKAAKAAFADSVESAKALASVRDIKELAALNDRTMKLIKDYATNYGAMTDPAAKGIVDSFLAIEKDRIQLMTSYTPKFRKVLPEVKVARYYQVENKIRAVVNYELAQEIPLAN